MTRSEPALSIIISVLILVTSGQYFTLQAQSDEQEVFLQFRYQNTVNSYISSVYADGEFYLSAVDLFNSLHINLDLDHGSMLLTGNYLGKGGYAIDFNHQTAAWQEQVLNLSADDFIITDLGYYLKPSVLQTLFDLNFTINFNELTVNLETTDEMPVVTQKKREDRRQRLYRTQNEFNQNFASLEFDRNPSILNAGFLDYTLTTNVNYGGNNHYLYSTTIGTEVLGGDFQGTVFGNYSETSSSLRSNGLRWRYGIRKNKWISSILAGQTTAEGLLPVAITGLNITNTPIEPRRFYGETAFSGTASPDSEVELYRNNTLIDFSETDESGSYRFIVPLTYGTSQYSMRIYNADGQVSQREARVQIPFQFLPPGDITYNISAGRLDNPVSGSTERGFVTKTDFSAGITNWLTTSAGVEYFDGFHTQLPSFHGSVSTRFLTSYLVSLEAANNAFYRANASVIYPSNASFNFNYTRFNQKGGVYNPGRNESTLHANIFTPFELGKLPFFVRLSFANNQHEDGSIFRYRADINTRINKATIRIGYRDTQTGAFSLKSTAVSRIQISPSYSFGRNLQTPALLRGIYLRGLMNYIPSRSEIEDAELQISRNIFKKGRFNLTSGHNFTGNFSLIRFSLAFDFNHVRSNTAVRASRRSSSFTQSIRGSAGFDSNTQELMLFNRQQAGRSGLAVRMFIDENENGVYDSNDTLIPQKAIRMGRAGGKMLTRKNITYITQLQPYRQYNMSVNKNAVNNPLLVPGLQRFSIITDPNQFKLIEIPFYMTGVVSGVVNRISPEGEKTGVSGIRLSLTQVNTKPGNEPHREEIRTFSDGSFYAYEIPPGDYELRADPNQIKFLQLNAKPKVLTFTIRSLANGDFAEGLELNLYP